MLRVPYNSNVEGCRAPALVLLAMAFDRDALRRYVLSVFGTLIHSCKADAKKIHL